MPQITLEENCQTTSVNNMVHSQINGEQKLGTNKKFVIKGGVY